MPIQLELTDHIDGLLQDATKHNCAEQIDKDISENVANQAYAKQKGENKNKEPIAHHDQIRQGEDPSQHSADIGAIIVPKLWARINNQQLVDSQLLIC